MKFFPLKAKKYIPIHYSSKEGMHVGRTYYRLIWLFSFKI